MKEDENKSIYLTYCIPAGLLVGTVIASVTSLNIGICAGVGMLVGVVIGSVLDYMVPSKK